MRFLATGPAIPDELLEERDAGNVVFFCGAGISRPAGLPNFLDLTTQVIAQCGTPEGSPLHDLLERIRSEPDFAPPLDQVFNRLQEDYGAAVIDDIVRKQLRTPKLAITEQHSIILRLSRNAAGKSQVVTTNFDRLFEKANSKLKLHVPPALPDLASGQPLEGLVYLHGRAAAGSANGIVRQGFVLSSSDFGRAYLADGWATRFVRELLKNYVIVLLGYSANDPPVRYLLEGLHSRGGERDTRAIYAFDKGSEDEVVGRWRGRGVTPLSYTSPDGSHSELWDTLRSWATRADDPDEWRRTIVSLAQTGPRNLEAFERGQVATLVGTDRGAKLFADAANAPPAEWLCVFDRNLRLATSKSSSADGPEENSVRPYGLDYDRPIPTNELRTEQQVGIDLLTSVVTPSTQVRVAGQDQRWAAPLPLRLFHIARWIARHLNDPVSAWWASGYRNLHGMLLEQIAWRLERSDEPLDKPAYKAWTHLLEQFRTSPASDPEGSWFRFSPVLKREGWGRSTLRNFENISRPYIQSERLSASTPPTENWSNLRLSDVISFKIPFPRIDANKLEITSTSLPAVLKIIRKNLELSVDILTDLEYRHWRTTTLHPEKRVGERHLSDKDRYLLLFANLFDRLAKENPDLARIETQSWIIGDEFFFDKLTMYALFKKELFSGRECAKRLLTLPERSFWNNYHRRELLHSLRARWDDFSQQERRLLEKKILAGPRKLDHEDENAFARRKAIVAASVLGWLQQQNCKLFSSTTRSLAKLRSAEPEWRSSWDSSADESLEGRAGWVRTESDASKIIDAPLSELVARAQQNTTRPFQEFTAYRPFIGVVKDRPSRAVRALSLEASRGNYPIEFWRNALSEWPKQTNDRLRCLFAARIGRLPNDVAFDLRFEIPEWFKKNLPRLAQTSPERAFQAWDAVVDNFFAMEPEATSSSIGEISIGGKIQKRSRRTYDHSINSPIGGMTRVLFDILGDFELAAGTGIPDEFRQRIERLYNAPGEGSDHAVCETALRLRWLFHIDPNWVQDRIIPFFAVHDEKSEAAWNGHLHDDRMPGPALFELLKPNFLQVFQHSSSWLWDDAPLRRLGEFLVTGCYWNLKDDRYLTYAEARTALQKATRETRDHAIFMLTNIVRDLKAWKTFGKAFVEKAWPLERKYQTAATSQAFAELATEADDRFADVVKTILPLLGPVDHVDILVHRVGKEDGEVESLATRFPAPMLAVLDRVIPDGPRTAPFNLREVLNEIADANPSLRQDNRWRRLNALLN
jgi:hypothetical protein